MLKKTSEIKEKFDSEIEEKYVASMVLGAVGDAIGYNDGSWEFCFNGEKIHEDLKNLGGLENLNINKW